MDFTVLKVSRDGIIVRFVKPIEKDFHIAKVHTSAGKIKTKLHRKLRDIDPQGERYAMYKNKFTRGIFSKAGMTNLRKLLKPGQTIQKIVQLSPIYKLLQPKKMTRKQYRFLRRSVEMLKENSISHGDLPDNVMQHPSTGMPVIIDFDEGNFPADAKISQMDSAAFMTHFKIGT
jgi:hypothetical protein